MICNIMEKASVVIIPITDEEHLRWIIETQTVDYRKRATQELSLFDNEDFVFADSVVAHSILLYRTENVLRYLTCLPVIDGSEPIPATNDDLKLLSYPKAKRANGTKRMYKYLMVIASFTHTRLTK